ncbi:MAG: DUF5781 family protein [Halobacteriaceae archaeon]
MDVRVTGNGPAAPFLGARDVFETEFDLERPVVVRVRDDPDERTYAGHHPDHHVLNISRAAATSAMARELALHEFAHMHRYEADHASHVLETEEVLYLSLAGTRIERRVLHHCYQLANHAKDIYADDITLSVGPTEKLVAFLESELAAAIADRPSGGRGQRITPAADPQLTAVNAAFALALLERHDAVTRPHPIYDLAHAAAEDAPTIDLGAFKRRFRDLGPDPDESEYRRALADVVRTYVDARGGTTSASD